MTMPTELRRLADDLFVWAPDGAGTWGLANCVLVRSGERAGLVDTPYSTALANELKAAARHVLPERVVIDTVVNTHANGDHSYGNGAFPEAEIITSRTCRDHLDREPSPAQMQRLVHGGGADGPLGRYAREHFGRFDWSDVQLRPATRTFSGRICVELGDVALELIEVGPAHSSGDVIVHLPRFRTVCTGDVVFIGDHPVHWAGPLANIVTACEKVLALRPELIVPGHGPVVGAAEVRAYAAYLRDVRERIHAMHAAGRPVGDAAAAMVREADRYGRLGLPERLSLVTEMEYQHLDGDPAPPDMLGRMRRSAELLYGAAPQPAPGGPAAAGPGER